MIMANKNIIVAIFVLCVAWQVQAQIDCTVTGAGRFADNQDTTCQNYTLCVLNPATNTYLSYNYTCPTTSVFNPATAQCTDSANYVCNVIANPVTPVCTAEGLLADPASSDCTTFIQCVQINGVFTQTVTTCPPNTFYNPVTTLCETTYFCTFACSAAGRFPDPASATCQDYYLCVLATNGTFVGYQYTCPTVSVFNPTTGLCTTNYICPV